MNLTDIDDKTIRNASDESKTLAEYTRPFITSFFEDIKTLNILPAHAYPRATEHVNEMIEIIKKLKTAGHTYESNGSIYFKISSYPEYGRLSNLDAAELSVSGNHRIDSDEYNKEQISDFVLWKAHVPEDGSVYYDTELGRGRPGWHIECSAMSSKYLGSHFDIHTGGVDNKFPHHENEIAQSQCAHGEKFVNYWLHCAHLMVEGSKMSKSLGNFYTLRDILDKGYAPSAVRYLLISSHYRNNLNFTLEGVTAAAKSIDRLRHFILDLCSMQGSSTPKTASVHTRTEDAVSGTEHADRRTEDFKTVPGSLSEILKSKEDAFHNAVCSDLNTSGALGSLFELMHAFYKSTLSEQKINAEKILDFLKKADTIFGVMDFSLEIPKGITLTPAEEKLIAERAAARKQKNWSESDRLRDLLLSAHNIIVLDTKEGQTCSRK